MEHTENLSLPYIMPSQAQKHVTHNEALRMLDAVVQLAVVDRDLSAPPPAPIPARDTSWPPRPRVRGRAMLRKSLPGRMALGLLRARAGLARLDDG